MAATLPPGAARPSGKAGPTLEMYDSLVKEVIDAKRLSGTKVQKLTEIAMKLLKHDIHLLSTHYRHHLSLPPSSQSKISSLYVLDSLSRAARSLYNKNHKQSKGSTEWKGAQYARGYLGKVEGVLEGMAGDMCAGGWVEGKEKMRKIHDIWSKNGTFPNATLDRVAAVIGLKTSTTSNEIPANAVAGPSNTSGDDGYYTGSPPKSSGMQLPAAESRREGQSGTGSELRVGQSGIGAIEISANEATPPPPPQDLNDILSLLAGTKGGSLSTPPHIPQPVLPDAPASNGLATSQYAGLLQLLNLPAIGGVTPPTAADVPLPRTAAQAMVSSGDPRRQASSGDPRLAQRPTPAVVTGTKPTPPSPPRFLMPGEVNAPGPPLSTFTPYPPQISVPPPQLFVPPPAISPSTAITMSDALAKRDEIARRLGMAHMGATASGGSSNSGPSRLPAVVGPIIRPPVPFPTTSDNTTFPRFPQGQQEHVMEQRPDRASIGSHGQEGRFNPMNQSPMSRPTSSFDSPRLEQGRMGGNESGFGSLSGHEYPPDVPQRVLPHAVPSLGMARTPPTQAFSHREPGRHDPSTANRARDRRSASPPSIQARSGRAPLPEGRDMGNDIRRKSSSPSSSRSKSPQPPRRSNENGGGAAVRSVPEPQDEEDIEIEMEEADDQFPAGPSTPTGPITSAPATTSKPAPSALDTFDWLSFDGQKPQSWSNLSAAYVSTHGKEPNQMEVMMLSLEGMQKAIAASAPAGVTVGGGVGTVGKDAPMANMMMMQQMQQMMTQGTGRGQGPQQHGSQHGFGQQQRQYNQAPSVSNDSYQQARVSWDEEDGAYAAYGRGPAAGGRGRGGPRGGGGHRGGGRGGYGEHTGGDESREYGYGGDMGGSDAIVLSGGGGGRR